MGYILACLTGCLIYPLFGTFPASIINSGWMVNGHKGPQSDAKPVFGWFEGLGQILIPSGILSLSVNRLELDCFATVCPATGPAERTVIMLIAILEIISAWQVIVVSLAVILLLPVVFALAALDKRSAKIKRIPVKNGRRKALHKHSSQTANTPYSLLPATLAGSKGSPPSIQLESFPINEYTPQGVA